MPEFIAKSSYLWQIFCLRKINIAFISLHDFCYEDAVIGIVSWSVRFAKEV